MKHLVIVLLVGWLFQIPLPAVSQKQLVLLKNEKVILRLYGGDEIVYKLKNDKSIHKSYVNNLYDTAVIVHHDVVPFHTIDRLYFRQSSYANVIGTAFVIGGAGYFLIDQFNVAVVQGDKPNLDENVTRTSAILLAVGLPMMLIHKKSQPIGGKFRLLTVEKGSPFYRPDTRSMEGLISNE